MILLWVWVLMGGEYRMDIRTSMMLLVTQNTGSEPLTVSISGNLGADGSGQHVTSEYASGSFRGMMSSVCQAHGDPSVNHLWIIDSSLSTSGFEK